MRSNIDIELVREYNKINNSYKSKCIYHVGCSAGFHSEVDAMIEYSCAMKSHFRKSGNQMSGKWKSSYASLLA